MSTIYVDANWDGSSAAPEGYDVICKTIADAVKVVSDINAGLEAGAEKVGATITVAAGVYDDDIFFRTNTKKQADAEYGAFDALTQTGDIVIQAAEGADVVVTGTWFLGERISQTTVVDPWNAEVTVSGITFDSTNVNGSLGNVFIPNVKKVTFDGCTFTGAGDGVQNRSGSASPADFISCTIQNRVSPRGGNFMFDGCTLSDCVDANGNIIDHGRINVQSSYGLTVKNCTVDVTVTESNADGFYVIRNNANFPVTLENISADVKIAEGTVLSEDLEEAPALFVRRTGSWTMENAEINLPEEAGAVQMSWDGRTTESTFEISNLSSTNNDADYLLSKTAGNVVAEFDGVVYSAQGGEVQSKVIVNQLYVSADVAKEEKGAKILFNGFTYIVGETAFGTIADAVKEAKKSTDLVTIEIGSGDYAEEVSYSYKYYIVDGKTYVGGIAFKAAEGADVNITGQIWTNSGTTDLKDISFDGLKMECVKKANGYYTPIGIQSNASVSASGISVTNCDLKSLSANEDADNRFPGQVFRVGTECIVLGWGVNVDGLVISGNTMEADCGIYTEGALVSNAVIADNDITGRQEISTHPNNQAWGGIYIIKAGENVEISGNTVDDTGYAALRVNGGQGVVVKNNEFNNSTNEEKVIVTDGSIVSQNTVDGEALTFPLYDGDAVFVCNGIAGTDGDFVVIDGKMYEVGKNAFVSIADVDLNGVKEINVIGDGGERGMLSATDDLVIKGGTVALNVITRADDASKDLTVTIDKTAAVKYNGVVFFGYYNNLNVQIDGSVIGYQLWFGSLSHPDDAVNVTVGSTGYLGATGEAMVFRYGADLMINGDKKQRKLQMDVNYLSFYSGTITVNDALVESGQLDFGNADGADKTKTLTLNNAEWGIRGGGDYSINMNGNSTIVLKNNSKLTTGTDTRLRSAVLMKDNANISINSGSSLWVGTSGAGSLSMTADTSISLTNGKLYAGSISNNGTISIDNNSMLILGNGFNGANGIINISVSSDFSGAAKLIDLTDGAQVNLGTVNILDKEDGDNLGYYRAEDGDLILYRAERTTLFVNAAWKQGTNLPDGLVMGVNAFASFTQALEQAKADADTTKITVLGDITEPLDIGSGFSLALKQDLVIAGGNIVFPSGEGTITFTLAKDAEVESVKVKFEGTTFNANPAGDSACPVTFYVDKGVNVTVDKESRVVIYNAAVYEGGAITVEAGGKFACVKEALNLKSGSGVFVTGTADEDGNIIDSADAYLQYSTFADGTIEITNGSLTVAQYINFTNDNAVFTADNSVVEFGKKVAADGTAAWTSNPIGSQAGYLNLTKGSVVIQNGSVLLVSNKMTVGTDGIFTVDESVADIAGDLYNAGEIYVKSSTLEVGDGKVGDEVISYNSSNPAQQPGFVLNNSGTVYVSGDSSLKLGSISGEGQIDIAAGTSLTDTTITDGEIRLNSGTVNFYGDNKLTGKLSVAADFDIVINKGASLLIARSGYVLGYDRDITINGLIKDATSMTADDLADTVLSLKADVSDGFSVGGTGTNAVTVNDAYVDLGNTSWKNSQAKHTWTFTNSYVKAASFGNKNAAGSTNASWTVTFDDSQLAASNYIKTGKGMTYNFTNGSVATAGSMRIDGALNISGGSIVTLTAYQNNEEGRVDEHGDISGSVVIDNGTLNIGSDAKTQVVELHGGAAVTVKNNGTLNLNGHTLDVFAGAAFNVEGTAFEADEVINAGAVSVKNGSFSAGKVSGNGSFVVSGDSEFGIDDLIGEILVDSDASLKGYISNASPYYKDSATLRVAGTNKDGSVAKLTIAEDVVMENQGLYVTVGKVETVTGENGEDVQVVTNGALDVKGTLYAYDFQVANGSTADVSGSLVGNAANTRQQNKYGVAYVEGMNIKGALNIKDGGLVASCFTTVDATGVVNVENGGSLYTFQTGGESQHITNILGTVKVAGEFHTNRSLTVAAGGKFEVNGGTFSLEDLENNYRWDTWAKSVFTSYGELSVSANGVFEWDSAVKNYGTLTLNNGQMTVKELVQKQTVTLSGFKTQDVKLTVDVEIYGADGTLKALYADLSIAQGASSLKFDADYVAEAGDTFKVFEVLKDDKGNRVGRNEEEMAFDKSAEISGSKIDLIEGTLTVGDFYNSSNSVVSLTDKSQITVNGKLGNDGMITINTADRWMGVKVLIDGVAEQTSFGKIILDAADEVAGVKIKVDDATGDLILYNVSTDTLYVDASWEDKYTFGQEVVKGSGKYFGINAFASADEAVKVAALDSKVSKISGDISKEDISLVESVTTENEKGLVVDLGNNGISFDENGAYTQYGKTITDYTGVYASEIGFSGKVWEVGSNVTVSADVLWVNENTRNIYGALKVNGVYIRGNEFNVYGTANISDTIVMVKNNGVLNVHTGGKLTAKKVFVKNSDKVFISGSADIDSLKTEEGGSVEVSGSLKSSSIESSGDITVWGSAAFKNLTSKGTVSVSGSLTGNLLENSGTVNVLGTNAKIDSEIVGYGSGTVNICEAADFTTSKNIEAVAVSVAKNAVFRINGTSVTAKEFVNDGTVVLSGKVSFSTIQNKGTVTVRGETYIADNGGIEVNSDIYIAENSSMIVDAKNSVDIQGYIYGAEEFEDKMSVIKVTEKATLNAAGIAFARLDLQGKAYLSGTAYLHHNSSISGTLSALGGVYVYGDTLVTGAINVTANEAMGDYFQVGGHKDGSLTVSGKNASINLMHGTNANKLQANANIMNNGQVTLKDGASFNLEAELVNAGQLNVIDAKLNVEGLENSGTVNLGDKAYVASGITNSNVVNIVGSNVKVDGIISGGAFSVKDGAIFNSTKAINVSNFYVGYDLAANKDTKASYATINAASHIKNTIYVRNGSYLTAYADVLAGSLYLKGNLTVHSTLTLNGTADNEVKDGGVLTIGKQGTLTNGFVFGETGVSDFNVGANGTLDVKGNLDMTAVNNGDSTSLNVAADGKVMVSGTAKIGDDVVNAGTVEVNGGTLTADALINSGTVTAAGKIDVAEIENSKTITVAKNGNVIADEVSNSGTIAITDKGQVSFGSLSNDGTVNVSGEVTLDIAEFEGNALKVADKAVIKGAVNADLDLAGNITIDGFFAGSITGNKNITVQKCDENDTLYAFNLKGGAVNTITVAGEEGKTAFSFTDSTVNTVVLNGIVTAFVLFEGGVVNNITINGDVDFDLATIAGITHSFGSAVISGQNDADLTVSGDLFVGNKVSDVTLSVINVDYAEGVNAALDTLANLKSVNGVDVIYATGKYYVSNEAKDIFYEITQGESGLVFTELTADEEQDAYSIEVKSGSLAGIDSPFLNIVGTEGNITFTIDKNSETKVQSIVKDANGTVNNITVKSGATLNVWDKITGLGKLTTESGSVIDLGDVSGTHLDTTISLGKNMKEAEFESIDLKGGKNTFSIGAQTDAVVEEDIANVKTLKIASGVSQKVDKKGKVTREEDKTTLNVGGDIVAPDMNSSITVGDYARLDVKGGLVNDDVNVGTTITVGENSNISFGGSLSGVAGLKIGAKSTFDQKDGQTIFGTSDDNAVSFGSDAKAHMGGVNLRGGKNSFSVGARADVDVLGYLKNVSTLKLSDGKAADTTDLNIGGVFAGVNAKVTIGKYADFDAQDMTGISKLTTGSSTVFDAALIEGTGKDNTISFGSSNKVNVAAIDLKDGKNSLTIGSKTDAVVAGSIVDVKTLKVVSGVSQKVDKKGKVTREEDKTTLNVGGDIVAPEMNSSISVGDYARLDVKGGLVNENAKYGTSVTVGENANVSFGGSLSGVSGLKVGAKSTFDQKDGQTITGTDKDNSFSFGSDVKAHVGAIDLQKGKNSFSVGARADVDVLGALSNVSTLKLSNGKAADTTTLDITGEFTGVNAKVTLGKYAALTAGNMTGISKLTTDSSSTLIAAALTGTAKDDTLTFGADNDVELVSVDLQEGKNSLSIGAGTDVVIAGDLSNISSLKLSNGTAANAKKKVEEDFTTLNIGNFNGVKANVSIGKYAAMFAENMTGVNKLSIGSNSGLKAKAVSATDKNDTFSIGNSLIVDSIDFGAGSDTISFSKNADLVIKGGVVTGLEAVSGNKSNTIYLVDGARIDNVEDVKNATKINIVEVFTDFTGFDAGIEEELNSFNRTDIYELGEGQSLKITDIDKGGFIKVSVLDENGEWEYLSTTTLNTTLSGTIRIELDEINKSDEVKYSVSLA